MSYAYYSLGSCSCLSDAIHFGCKRLTKYSEFSLLRSVALYVKLSNYASFGIKPKPDLIIW